mmetsp:Transcript_33855/g.58515  ORF Transcript_33855/g.58515 Transcript_33855/m.58515 type:complete len:96 (+) Transcript_33855:226-513(+)
MGRFCLQHKVRGMVDVNNKSGRECRNMEGQTWRIPCAAQAGGHGGCEDQESDQGDRFCKQLKLQGMEDVFDNRCEQAGCGNWPFCGARNGGCGGP